MGQSGGEPRAGVCLCSPAVSAVLRDCCRSFAKRKTEAIDDEVQLRRAPSRWSRSPFETFGEDLATAQDCVAAEAARRSVKRRRCQVWARGGNRSASRTQTNAFACPHRDNGPYHLRSTRSLQNPRGTRLELWSTCCMALSLAQSKRQTFPQTAFKSEA